MGNAFGNGSTNKSHNRDVKTSKGASSSAAHTARDVADEKDQAILQLKNTRDKLKRYRKQMDGESKRLETQVKELLKRGQKERAFLVLKLKRFKEKQASDCDAHLFNILSMIDNVEWATVNQEVFSAIKVGKDQLEKMNEQLSIDDVEALLEENREAAEVQEQISNLLGSQSQSVEEDESLLADLAIMMEESNKTTGGAATTATSAATATSAVASALPDAPMHIPSSSFPEVPTGIKENVHEEDKRSSAAPIAM